MESDVTSYCQTHGDVAELADALDLGSTLPSFRVFSLPSVFVREIAFFTARLGIFQLSSRAVIYDVMALSWRGNARNCGTIAAPIFLLRIRQPIGSRFFHGRQPWHTYSSATIRKELTTFRQIWVWAQRRGHVANSCPLLGPEKRWELQLPKPVERVKFQTWEQIERRIERGGLSSAEIRKLWEGLYLDEDRIRELLVFFKEHAAYSFIYPMLAFGVYTGARRSEILRSQIDDIDFQTDQIIIRERKRRKHLAASTRYVPLHPRLRSDLKEWFEVHPGGQFTIACPEYMQRRKRTNGPQQLTLSQATHHFKHTLRKSKWDVIRGFHVLRHSFGSNLARSGKVPSEVIAAWMGHTTEEMRSLYQHLFPQDGVRQISVLQ